MSRKRLYTDQKKSIGKANQYDIDNMKIARPPEEVINPIGAVNTGVLVRPLSPTDFVLGASAIAYEQRVPDFNWTPWLPEDERQSRPGVFDTMSCVTFSALNCVEIQLNWLYDKRKIPQAAVDFLMNNGYYKNGKFNCSDRFIAIMSDTLPTGNYLDKVDYTIRKCGLIPESMLPFGGSNWNEYMDKSMITQEMINMGLEFNKYFNTQYEAIFYPGLIYPTTAELKKLIREQLMHAPLHIATAVCPGWHQSPIIAMCNESPSHATAMSGLVWEQFFMDYDHYTPFQKKLSWDYNVPIIFKVVINPITTNQVDVEHAKAKVKEIMTGRKTQYFFRPDAYGEAYVVNIDGSFKYKKGAPCPLFTSMCEDGTITPVSESLWREISAAEIK